MRVAYLSLERPWAKMRFIVADGNLLVVFVHRFVNNFVTHGVSHPNLIIGREFDGLLLRPIDAMDWRGRSNID